MPLKNQVGLRASGQLHRHRSLEATPAHCSGEPQPAHQASHGATRHRVPLAIELTPDFAYAVDLEVALPHPPDLATQNLVPLRSRRAQPGIGFSGLVRVVGGRSDRQDRTDRLDSVLLPVVVDEGGGRAPPLRNPPTLCAGSRLRASAHGPLAPAPSGERAHRWLVPPAYPGSARPGAPSCGASHPSSRSSRQSTGCRPTARGTRARGRTPSARPSPSPRENTSSVCSWLQSLKRWSLRQSRGGSRSFAAAHSKYRFNA